MAGYIQYSDEQRENRAAIVARLFRLPNADQVAADFSIESAHGGKAMLKIEMLEYIDMDTAHKLINGLPDAEPGSEPTA